MNAVLQTCVNVAVEMQFYNPIIVKMLFYCYHAEWLT